jgi:hypothetical protein
VTGPSTGHAGPGAVAVPVTPVFSPWANDVTATMDEVLEVVDVAADLGLEGALTWLLRVVGLLLVFAGIGVFLLTEVTLLVPVALVVGGFVLLVAPSVLLLVAEFA